MFRVRYYVFGCEWVHKQLQRHHRHAYCRILAVEIKQHLGQNRCVPFLAANMRCLYDSGVRFIWRHNSPFARSVNDPTRGADDCHGRRIIYVPNSVRGWIQWLKCWTVKRVSSPGRSDVSSPDPTDFSLHFRWPLCSLLPYITRTGMSTHFK